MKLLTLATLATTAASSLHSDFNQWSSKHGRVYSGEDTTEIRFQIWKKNNIFITKHNARFQHGLTTFTVAHNQFSDMTNKEYRTNVLGHAKTRPSADPVVTNTPLVTPPPSWDWRTKGVVTAVKDQGSCGSCWAFSAIASIEGAYNWKNNGTNVPSECGSVVCGKQQMSCCSLSEQELVDCVKNGIDNCQTGGLPSDGMLEIAKQMQGHANTEQQYPYTSGDGSSTGKCKNKTSAIDIGLTGFKRVTSGDEKGMLTFAYTQPILSIAIDASQDSFQFYSSGVYIDDNCKNGPDDLDHGVAIVGYGNYIAPPGPAPSPYPDCVANADQETCDAAPKCNWCADSFFCSNSPCNGNGDSPLATGKGLVVVAPKNTSIPYWIVRNSWGSEYGEEGYILMARDRNNQCGVATNAIFATIK